MGVSYFGKLLFLFQLPPLFQAEIKYFQDSHYIANAKNLMELVTGLALVLV